MGTAVRTIPARKLSVGDTVQSAEFVGKVLARTKRSLLILDFLKSPLYDIVVFWLPFDVIEVNLRIDQEVQEGVKETNKICYITTKGWQISRRYKLTSILQALIAGRE